MTERGEDIFKRFTTREILGERVNGTKAFDKVILGRRMVDKRFERRRW